MAARLTTYVVVAIVAATLIAGLIVGAQRDDEAGPVDVIVFNARVFTADGSDGRAEAVAIRGNQILRVGSDREIARLRRPQTLMVDAAGGSVLPGFNDAASRVLDGGLVLDTVDLSGAVTEADVLARIETWASAHPLRPWVVGRGWSAEMFSKAGPTRQQLDSIVEDRPAYMISADGHAAWVNTAALGRAGILRRSGKSARLVEPASGAIESVRGVIEPASGVIEPASGVIEKDPRTGLPSGVLRRAAIARVARLLPPATREERAQALRAAIAEAHAQGITSVQDAGVSADDIAIYDEARRAGDLTLRVYASLVAQPDATTKTLADLDSVSARYPDDPLFKAGGVRVTVVDSPAVDEAHAGAKAPPAGGTAPDALNRLVRLLDARGFQITVEAPGERAARLALDAFEHAAMSNPEPARGRRHRIESSGAVDRADLPKFGPLGLIAVLRPAAPVAAVDLETATAPQGESVPVTTSLAAALTAARIRLALATGWPDSAVRPLESVVAAVARPETEGLTLVRRVEAFTSSPAYASFDEQRKGSIEPGMLADLVVLSRDIFAAPAATVDATAAADVAVTIFDGRIVYRRSARPTN